ncbi:hypothetical protein SCHPADRAFT_894304 [Schizopora paradoxa]|uniref:Uncharacterized protein n=1 Tax=Schizopora paradoxa TaxID=27342 RepID=A0A0H2R7L9_9AGAM|nr:hypothetical protein SCHPADRAFT_894304 [Schizopora paradoxa]
MFGKGASIAKRAVIAAANSQQQNLRDATQAPQTLSQPTQSRPTGSATSQPALTSAPSSNSQPNKATTHRIRALQSSSSTLLPIFQAVASFHFASTRPSPGLATSAALPVLPTMQSSYRTHQPRWRWAPRKAWRIYNRSFSKRKRVRVDVDEWMEEERGYRVRHEGHVEMSGAIASQATKVQDELAVVKFVARSPR